MLKTVGKKMGLVDKELGQFKKCIDKVPILAQCVNTEKDRVKRVISRPAAASAAYTPLLSGQDEGSCSQEKLYTEITRLKQEGDLPTLELITCYRNLRDNPEFNRQIEESRHKDVYKMICLVLNRLDEEEKREEEKREAAELNRSIEHGDYNRALLLYEKCLATSKRDLGEDHLDTLKLLKKLAIFFSQMVYTMDRAVPLYEEILARNRRVLGDDDPDTLTTLKNLAAIFQMTRKHDRAVPLYEELLTKQKRVLGDNHPDTLESLKNLAGLLKNKGEYDRAEPLYEEILVRDPYTLATYYKKELDDCRNRKQQQKEGAAQAQAQAPVPIEIQSTLPTLPNSTGGKSKNKRNHKNKSFRSTRRRRYSRARGGKKIAASSSKTIKRRRKNAR